MFQNLVMTGLTPLCNTNEIRNWDNRPFNGIWPECQRSSRQGSEIKTTIKKKPKRVRTAYTTDQLRALEKLYATRKYIDVKRRKQIAETLKITEKSLKTWFQNRRQKEKKETSESSCNTSSEIVSCQSPALKNDCVEPKEQEFISFSNYSDSNEPAQYQFPSFYYNESATVPHYQTPYPYEQNDSSFGVDSSVYPTQYPVNFQYNTTEINASSQSQNAHELDSWYAKSFDLSYFTTSTQQAQVL